MKYEVVDHRHRKITADGEGVMGIYSLSRRTVISITDEVRRRIGELANI